MGFGIIAVSPHTFADILKAPRGKQHHLENTPLDSVQAALLLPDGYTVVRIGVDEWRGVYLVAVESDQLPVVPEGRLAPEVTPVYQATYHEDGTVASVAIVKIAVRVPEDHRPWHPQSLPNREE
jgi:hypothetical protein